MCGFNGWESAGVGFVCRGAFFGVSAWDLGKG